jgi:phage tail-like protein
MAANFDYSNYAKYYVTCKFWVELQGILQASFTECSGLEVATEVFSYPEGGLNSYTHKLPARSTVGNITLKRGVVLDDRLWLWYSDVLDGKITRNTLTIRLFDDTVDSQRAPAISWQLENAIPVKWSGPALRGGDSSIAIDTIEFACGAFKRITRG